MNNNDIKTVTLTINSEQAQRKLDDINRRLKQARLNGKMPLSAATARRCKHTPTIQQTKAEYVADD